jgi:hypothetical protein
MVFNLIQVASIWTAIAQLLQKLLLLWDLTFNCLCLYRPTKYSQKVFAYTVTPCHNSICRSNCLTRAFLFNLTIRLRYSEQLPLGPCLTKCYPFIRSCMSRTLSFPTMNVHALEYRYPEFVIILLIINGWHEGMMKRKESHGPGLFNSIWRPLLRMPQGPNICNQNYSHVLRMVTRIKLGLDVFLYVYVWTQDCVLSVWLVVVINCGHIRVQNGFS